VRRTSWKSHEPGDDVPRNGADEAAANHIGIDCSRIDELIAYGLCHTRAEEEGSNKIEESGPKDSLSRREDPGGDNGCHRVGCVMEAVEEIEDESYSNQNEDEVEDWHRFLNRS
jgi:hypothetical protein